MDRNRWGSALVAGGLLGALVLAPVAASADDPNLKFQNYRYGNCMYASDELGSHPVVGGVGDGVSCLDWLDARNVWEWHYVRKSPEGSNLYQIRFPVHNPDLCVSVVGHEGGDTHIGEDTQLEGCEAASEPLTSRDDLFTRGQLASGRYHIHNYVVDHADLCLEADPYDVVGGATVQLQDCGAGGSIEWKWFAA